MRILYIAVCILVLVSACDKKPKNPADEYGNLMLDSYQKGKQAGVTGNLEAVKLAVQAYHASNDKYPRNLEEIQPLLGGSEMDFSKYDYDPENGTVTLKNN